MENRRKKILTAVLVLSLAAPLVTAAPVQPVYAAESPETERTEAAREQGDIVPGEILVVYDDAGASGSGAEKIQREAEEELAGMDIAVTGTVAEPGGAQGTVVTAEIPQDMSVEDAVQQAADADAVSYAQPNYVYRLLDQELEPMTAVNDMYVADGSAYYLESTKATQAWDLKRSEHGSTVAVFDTGCRMSHKDLKDNLLSAYAYDAYEDKALTKLSASSGDPNGHGTHVSGLIAAKANNAVGIAGTSYNANILPVKIFDDYGENATTESALRAMRYVEGLIDRKQVENLHVINFSFGHYPADFPEGADATEDTAFLDEIRKLKEQYGVLCVCAGGNGNNGVPRTDEMFPSDCEACLSVVSLTREGRTSEWADYNAAKDIAAPGENIVSTYSFSDYRYESLSGTSMAAPIVSGICALLWAENPELTVDEVMEAVKNTASPVPDAPAGSGSRGAIDARKALEYVRDRQYVKKPAGTQSAAGSGQAAKTAPVSLKGTKITKLKSRAGGFLVKWKKQAKQADGYQIQYSVKKNFKKAAAKKIKKPKAAKKVISGLKRHKTYYVRIRTFKRINGKLYYSGWSGKKKVRIR